MPPRLLCRTAAAGVYTADVSTSAEITAVRPGHRFDERRLVGYLADRLEGFDGELSVRQFEGGQSNPTFMLSAGARRFVLRKKPPGELLPTAHMIEREFRVLQALRGTDVPVPEPLLLCEDASVIGTPFYVMGHAEGRLFRDPSLPTLAAAERGAVYAEMARVLAALHRVDPLGRGLGDFGRPGNYYARQIRRWSRQYEASKTDALPAMDRLMAWLPERVPQDDTTCLVHGDFRLDNMVVHARQPRVVAVLDWELSTLGHPLADLAYNCMLYHIETPDGVRLGDVAGGAGGIPSEADYVALYCRHTGRDEIPGWNFYLAFSLFRYASIVQGVYHRGLQGNASSAYATRMGRLARIAAEQGWALAQGAQSN